MYEEKRKNINRGKDIALQYLNYGDRTTYQMVEYLKKKDIEKDDIEEIIKYLKEFKYIDDYRYAEIYARQLEQKGEGREKAIYKMKSKGLSLEIIEEVLAENQLFAFDHQLVKALAIKEKLYIEKGYEEVEGLSRNEIYDKKQKIKGKLARKLQNKGFHSNVIVNVLKDEM